MKAFGHWSLLLNKKLNRNPFDTKALPIDFALIYMCVCICIYGMPTCHHQNYVRVLDRIFFLSLQ